LAFFMIPLRDAFQIIAHRHHAYRWMMPDSRKVAKSAKGDLARKTRSKPQDRKE